MEDVREIEITPEMIEAGVLELRERTFGEPLERVARDVYLAMATSAAVASKKAPPERG